MPKKETPKTQRLLDELRQWCDEPPTYGKRKRVGDIIGVSSQTITNWFAGEQNPTSEQVLNIQDFLKQRDKQPRRKKPAHSKKSRAHIDAERAAQAMDF